MERKTARPHDIVFGNTKGKPDSEVDMVAKRVAQSAGLSCGYGVTEHGNKCAEGPHCRNFFLHKFRHTFATNHRRDDVDTRTVQAWMKHPISDPVISRRSFLGAGTSIGASLLLGRKAEASAAQTSTSQEKSNLSSHTFSTPRHTTLYWRAGPADRPLMIFLHGWPEIGLVWRAQIESFASEGWHCVAPDMRGYGSSSAPKASEAYALQEIVQDMVELHDHLGAHPAIWVGHDLGSPVVGALAAHHPERSRGVVFVSVPYFPEAFALPSLLPLVDRQLYPADQYPDGQWDDYRFYLTHFDQTVTDFDADIPATLGGDLSQWESRFCGKALPVRIGHAEWRLVWFGSSRSSSHARSSPLASNRFWGVSCSVPR